MRYFLFILILITSSKVLAQLDTLVLEEVSIYGIPTEKYAIGQKVVKIDSSVLQHSQDQNLSSFLSNKASVYMKMYGSNMASTIAFRGTGPSHTAVIWNGLEISSITLGQMDFSLVPVFVADEMTLHYGSASALYGSGAIGGAVRLNSVPKWGNDLSVNLVNNYGSFNTYYSGANVSVRNENIESKTKFYYSYSDNNFEYELPSTGEKINQNNASYEQYGLAQDLNFRISSSQQLLFNGWFTKNYRQLQPVIGDFNNVENLEDQSLRVAGSYHNNSKLGYFIYRLGYLHDDQNYNETSEIITDRLINSAQYDKRLGALSLQVGVNWINIQAEVENYARTEKEDRVSLFALGKYHFDKLKASLNLRQTLVTGYNVPLSPSLGVEFELNKQFSITAQASRNYRVPTLNDRNWVPGGNPDVQPELSYNAESGLVFKSLKNLQLSINYYKMWVNDWIIWLPTGGIWSPQNINKVNSEGIELNIHHALEMGILKFVVDAEYAFNKAITKETYQSNERALGKQLAYTPEHTAALSLSANIKTWSLYTNTSFTGERYTDSNNTLTPLESFVLLDIGISREFKISDQTISTSFQVRNMLNQEYQTLRNRAMPGRNFRLNLIFKFYKSNKNQ